jgi:hypothetical protein
MDMEFIFIQMEIYIRDNGSMDKSKKKKEKRVYKFLSYLKNN